MPSPWEERLEKLWEALPDLDPDEFVNRMEALTAELPPDQRAISCFERAGAFDSTGSTDQAIPLYREALALGLPADRRRQATIQLASSLRVLGHTEESLALLIAERDAGSDELDDAVSAFLALALASVGREREATSVALTSLATHLPRYQRSVGNYARLLLTEASA